MQEQVVLVGCHTSKQSEETFESSMEELKRLAETVDSNIVAVFTQKRERIQPSHYLGKGKTEEIATFIEENEVDVVIVDQELSPTQSRNLSNEWEARVIDRTQLILDIFAMRAQTKEGKLQVELAQLQYLLPRLHGQGTSLSRLGGGIGTRGPGETKLESDQRHIRRRITEIKRSIEQVVNQRKQYRERRKKNAAFQIALVGYTNAGKSTIFNQLGKTDMLAEDKLFATLDPKTNKIKLPSGFQPILSDTVGFIQHLPTTLIAAFRSTLEEVLEADLILHVVDSSNPQIVDQEQTVKDILTELGASHIPVLTVYNKSDQTSEDFIPYSTPHILMSAHRNEDMIRLKSKIEETLLHYFDAYEVKLNSDQGKKLDTLKRETIVAEESFIKEDETYHLLGYVHTHSPLYQELVK
ncbi:GTPase HflX [Halalkalibacillus halophilus]|uniref:GTPase HflX n=1 Tax=Halalkalibacillus halophilus TaxID=392827 RepID=UPI0003FDBB12|nr:GTPase HflX [Halalkalibacillus halophilus]